MGYNVLAAEGISQKLHRKVYVYEDSRRGDVHNLRKRKGDGRIANYHRGRCSDIQSQEKNRGEGCGGEHVGAGL